jgi:hypothetical protein
MSYDRYSRQGSLIHHACHARRVLFATVPELQRSHLAGASAKVASHCTMASWKVRNKDANLIAAETDLEMPPAGADIELETLPNRPGTAALGPYTVLQIGSIWGDHYNTDVQHLKFIAANSSHQTKSSHGCSYCPFDELARREYLLRTHPLPYVSLSKSPEHLSISS